MDVDRAEVIPSLVCIFTRQMLPLRQLTAAAVLVSLIQLTSSKHDSQYLKLIHSPYMEVDQKEYKVFKRHKEARVITIIIVIIKMNLVIGNLV